MLSKKSGLLIPFLFLFISGSLLAQAPGPRTPAQELRLGIWVSATLHAGEEHWYRVETISDGLLIVESSGNTDTYLEAYDASLYLIDENDDGGNGYNARIEVFTEADNTYFFKLRGYNQSESGPYRIMASFEEIPADIDQNIERSRAVPIQAGQTVPVFFRSRHESRWYRAIINETDKLFIAYTAGYLDTMIVLYDALGRELGEDDDSGDGYNARLSVPADSGTIYIEVKTYNGIQGRTALHTEGRDRGRPDRYEPDNTISGARDISVGETQERTFTDANDVDWVRLRISQSAVYEISTFAADGRLDSYLELYDSNENLIDEDDDSGGNLDALIRIRLNPAIYYIKVSCIGRDPLDDNRYTLSVQRAR
jgi:hypothetical protein